MMRRPGDLVNRPNGLIELVLVPCREAGAPPVAVVRLEELRLVTDVKPLAAEPEAVDGRPRMEPGDEVAGLVGRVVLREVGAKEREVGPVVDIRRDRDQVRFGGL